MPLNHIFLYAGVPTYYSLNKMSPGLGGNFGKLIHYYMKKCRLLLYIKYNGQCFCNYGYTLFPVNKNHTNSQFSICNRGSAGGGGGMRARGGYAAWLMSVRVRQLRRGATYSIPNIVSFTKSKEWGVFFFFFLYFFAEPLIPKPSVIVSYPITYVRRAIAVMAVCMTHVFAAMTIYVRRAIAMMTVCVRHIVAAMTVYIQSFSLHWHPSLCLLN